VRKNQKLKRIPKEVAHPKRTETGEPLNSGYGYGMVGIKVVASLILLLLLSFANHDAHLHQNSHLVTKHNLLLKSINSPSLLSKSASSRESDHFQFSYDPVILTRTDNPDAEEIDFYESSISKERRDSEEQFPSLTPVTNIGIGALFPVSTQNNNSRMSKIVKCTSAAERRQEMPDPTLGAVKKRQVRFGGKVELATEGNEEVLNLCTKLEMYWLRSVPNEQSLERYLGNDDSTQHVEEFSVSESAPIGAEFHKPNIFSTLLNSSAAPFPRASAKVSKVKSARPVTMATMTGRLTRNKAASTRSNSGTTRQKKTVEIVKESVPAEKNQKGKATKAPSKKVRVSFAPDNFEFKLNSPPLTSEPAQSRGRRRSRRISGVQPDPTLSKEDLCMTPAKRAKDRPASRDRRQSLQCGMCPKDHTWATPRG